MKHLLIENKGELDIASLILLGASTKRGDSSKIGFFGSGNKYAIATLIKYGINFEIYSGDRKIDITTEDVIFRDMKFKKIIIDGKETSLTTSMGPQWEPWMAIREWVSNSLDEGGYNMITDTSIISGRDGYTRFFVEHHPMISDLIENWGSYFAFEREDSLFKYEESNVYPQTDPENNVVLYRKGIRCYFDKGVQSLYQYDIDSFDINESRLIDSLYSAELKVSKLLNKCDNVEVLKSILKNAFIEDKWEARLPWRWGTGGPLNKAWREAIDDRCIIVDTVSGYYLDIQNSRKCYIVSLEMAFAIRSAFPDVTIYGIDDSGNSIGYKATVTTPKQDFILKEVIKFCGECGYSVEYPLEVVDFEDRDVLGQAHKGTILLSSKIFDMGRKQVALTIIEENEHLKTGYKDCSRAFQNHLFNLFLTEKEERFGYFL